MKTLTRVLLALYVAYALVMFCVFVYGDFQTPVQSHPGLKLAFMITNLVLCAYLFGYGFYHRKERKYERLFLLLASAFTLAADVFLLILQRDYLIGVILFFIAQNLHFLRFVFVEEHERKVCLIALGYRLALMGVGLLVALILQYRDVLSLVAIVYFACLVCNFVDALSSAIRRRYCSMWVLAIGFLLFIGCDVMVGLNAIGDLSLRSVVYPYIWLFYTLAQGCIIGSGFLRHEEA